MFNVKIHCVFYTIFFFFIAMFLLFVRFESDVPN